MWLIGSLVNCGFQPLTRSTHDAVALRGPSAITINNQPEIKVSYMKIHLVTWLKGNWKFSN